MKKRFLFQFSYSNFLIPIFLFQFLIFLNANQALGQTKTTETEVCDTIIAEGKMKFFLCKVTITQYRDADRTNKFSYTREIKTKKLMFNIDNGEQQYVFASSVGPYFKQVKAAKREYNISKIKKVGGIAVSFLGLSSGLVTAIVAGSEGNTGLAIGAAVGGLAIGWGGLVIAGTGYNHVIKAAKKYNEGMKSVSFNSFSLKPDYLSLGNAQGTAGVSIGWHLYK